MWKVTEFVLLVFNLGSEAATIKIMDTNVIMIYKSRKIDFNIKYPFINDKAHNTIKYTKGMVSLSSNRPAG